MTTINWARDFSNLPLDQFVSIFNSGDPLDQQEAVKELSTRRSEEADKLLMEASKLEDRDAAVAAIRALLPRNFDRIKETLFAVAENQKIIRYVAEDLVKVFRYYQSDDVDQALLVIASSPSSPSVACGRALHILLARGYKITKPAGQSSLKGGETV